MTSEAIEKFFETQNIHANKSIKIDFKKRNPILSLIIRGNDYEDLKSKNEVWRPFVMAVLTKLDEINPNIVYMLWGAKAKEFKGCFKNGKLMFYGHPSTVNARLNSKISIQHYLAGEQKKLSVERPGDGMMVRFKLTDFSKEVTVEYTGILPDNQDHCEQYAQNNFAAKPGHRFSFATC